MEPTSFEMFGDKVILRLKDRVCLNADELFASPIFLKFLRRSVDELARRNSKLLGIFEHTPVSDEDLVLLTRTFRYLMRLSSSEVPCIIDGSAQFFRDKQLFNDFIEFLYNNWRHFQRLIICDSVGDTFDQRPYRTFNSTIESLTHLVRSTYRDLQENTTGRHPQIYRQVPAGAEMAAIAAPREVPYSPRIAAILNPLSVIRQVLIYPPLIFNTATNKRTGSFERTEQDLLAGLNLHSRDWLCYPARIGELVVLVYFSLKYYDLNMTLCNLFELATDADLQRQPDAVLLFGVPSGHIQPVNGCSTVFQEDPESAMLIGAIPDEETYGYFGYVKKMALTLHNVCMMKKGRMPFHGAMFHLALRGVGTKTVLVIGDTGAGKSETLEAMRALGSEIEDITIIADDMGSLVVQPDGSVLGYGTETGAFVRLDDLQPGYAFGQIDRTILMNANQTNARVVIPVTTLEIITRGFQVDMVLYANNYEEVDDAHPVIDLLPDAETALNVFRSGAAMSKGTTTSTGLTHTYFVNIFGPTQYIPIHEELARETFEAFYRSGVLVAQMRTQLGVTGKEHNGPIDAARALLKLLGQ